VLDPFCGSGAVLMAARRRGIPVSGVDINPVAALFSRVKLHGFDSVQARRLVLKWVERSRQCRHLLAVEWESKDYWFTPTVVEKFERLRFVGREMRLHESADGAALLLCFSLAIRLCSRADQRSPKPFISKQAYRIRRGLHFDPYRTILSLLNELSLLYGRRAAGPSARFLLADLSNDPQIADRLGSHSHAITSPPYINAQDYFRNFKLELYFLERLLPFRVDDLRTRFIGTERGDLLSGVPEAVIESNFRAVPCLRQLERRDLRLAGVVHRYLHDMGKAFDNVRDCLRPGGCFVLVCGDNLVGGLRIRTWQVLQRMIERLGFELFDRFTDPIGDRLLAPKRSGHKGLIKEEVVSAFRLA
jgi:SAM-dependent methyltransferase